MTLLILRPGSLLSGVLCTGGCLVASTHQMPVGQLPPSCDTAKCPPRSKIENLRPRLFLLKPPRLAAKTPEGGGATHGVQARHCCMALRELHPLSAPQVLPGWDLGRTNRAALREEITPTPPAYSGSPSREWESGEPQPGRPAQGARPVAPLYKTEQSKSLIPGGYHSRNAFCCCCCSVCLFVFSLRRRIRCWSISSGKCAIL